MIQVFVLPYDWVMQQIPLARIQEILPEDDISKAKRFIYQSDQDRYLSSRLFLFALLKQQEIINYDSLNLSYNIFGKPFLPGIDVHFNWSHSGDMIALVISNTICGIDIELHSGKEIYDYQSFCTELELEWLNKKDVGSEYSEIINFMSLWTAKESVVKAKGTGLYTDPRYIEIIHEKSKKGQWISKHDSSYHGYTKSIHWNDQKYSLSYCSSERSVIYPIFSRDIVKDIMIYIQN